MERVYNCGPPSILAMVLEVERCLCFLHVVFIACSFAFILLSFGFILPSLCFHVESAVIILY